MNDLFDHANKYPEAVGHAKGSDTSKEAAERLTDRKKLHETIIDVLANIPAGLTVDEIKPILEKRLRRKFDRSTVAARFTELKSSAHGSRIYETAEKRLTPMNRNARVYKISH